MGFCNDNLAKSVHKKDFPKDFLTELAETLRNTADFPELSRDALTLLCLAVFFNPQIVPVEWFDEVTGLSKSSFQATLGELEEYGLLVPGNTGTNRYMLICPVPLEIPTNCAFRTKYISKIRHKCEDDLLLRDVFYWSNSGNSWQIVAIAGFYKNVYRNWTVETEESEIDLNLTWALGILGNLYFTWGESDSSKEMYQMIHTISGVLQDLSISCERLGDMEYDDQRMASARIYYVKDLDIRERLAEQMPEDEVALRSLSAAYDRLGDVESYDENWEDAREFLQRRWISGNISSKSCPKT